MNSKLCLAAVLIVLLALAGGCASMSGGPSLYEQFGGKAKVDALASGFLDRCAKDPVLTSLVGGKDLGKLAPKFADGICATLGGGCTRPYTDTEVRSAAARVNPAQIEALKGHFGAALEQLGTAPELQEKIKKAASNRLGPILAVLH